jgi:hypothetical protein
MLEAAKFSADHEGILHNCTKKSTSHILHFRMSRFSQPEALAGLVKILQEVQHVQG